MYVCFESSTVRRWAVHMGNYKSYSVSFMSNNSSSLQPWEEPLVTCTGCSLVLVLPIPSTVVTATWCKVQMGARQALAEKWLEPQIKVIPLTI